MALVDTEMVETMSGKFVTFTIPERLPPGEYAATLERKADGSLTVVVQPGADVAPSPEVAGANGVVGCTAVPRGGFSFATSCLRGCRNDGYGCKARRERERQGLPAGPVFVHDEALLDSLVAAWVDRTEPCRDELWDGLDPKYAKEIAKTYCEHMMRRRA